MAGSVKRPGAGGRYRRENNGSLTQVQQTKPADQAARPAAVRPKPAADKPTPSAKVEKGK